MESWGTAALTANSRLYLEPGLLAGDKPPLCTLEAAIRDTEISDTGPEFSSRKCSRCTFAVTDAALLFAIRLNSLRGDTGSVRDFPRCNTCRCC